MFGLFLISYIRFTVFFKKQKINYKNVDSAPPRNDISCVSAMVVFDMNIHQALKVATKKLVHLENPPLEAEVLLATLLNKNRTWLRAHDDHTLTFTQSLKYKWWTSQRALHKPVAYITGEVEWNGLNLKVNKHTLIPRDETEILCLHVTEAQTKAPKNILDLGTGSGCIAIYLAKNWPQANVTALDISSLALQTAQNNATLNQIMINFQLSDMLSALNTNTHIDLIVANLPYVPKELTVTAEVSQEPKTAIFSGDDGLDHIRSLAAQIKSKTITFNQLWLEFLPSQTKDIETIFNDYKLSLKPVLMTKYFSPKLRLAFNVFFNKNCY